MNKSERERVERHIAESSKQITVKELNHLKSVAAIRSGNRFGSRLSLGSQRRF